MTNEDGSVAIVVNGEIYNHAELRADLEAKGHRFRSASDSEVVVHLYEEVGARTPEFLRGMFALAVWDARAATLLLARDRFGEKPLFYCERPDGFVFASEIAALVADPRTPTEVSLTALDSYLALQYVPAPHTIYAGINKLPAAHILELRCGGRRSCAATTARRSRPRSPASARRRRRGACAKPSRRRCARGSMSDVPLGAFLSGGSIRRSSSRAWRARPVAASRRFRSASPRAIGSTTSCPMPAWSPNAIAPTTTSWSSIPTWSACFPASSGITASRSPTRRRSPPATFVR